MWKIKEINNVRLPSSVLSLLAGFLVVVLKLFCQDDNTFNSVTKIPTIF